MSRFLVGVDLDWRLSIWQSDSFGQEDGASIMILSDDTSSQFLRKEIHKPYVQWLSTRIIPTKMLRECELRLLSEGSCILRR